MIEHHRTDKYSSFVSLVIHLCYFLSFPSFYTLESVSTSTSTTNLWRKPSLHSSSNTSQHKIRQRTEILLEGLFRTLLLLDVSSLGQLSQVPSRRSWTSRYVRVPARVLWLHDHSGIKTCVINSVLAEMLTDDRWLPEWLY